MLSNDEILGLWAEGMPQAPARPVLGSRKVVAFARAVERAAYERAAALVVELTEDSTTADAIRALGRQ